MWANRKRRTQWVKVFCSGCSAGSTSVALSQFIVLKRKGQWAVKSNDQERSCSSQLEAIHAAIQLANECGKNGKASVVLLQAAKNQFETIWTYGESPFPPAKSDLPPLSEAS
jgi:hypothetical protein